MDLRRHDAGTGVARPGRRQFRDHPGQPRVDRALDRLPRRCLVAARPDAHDRPRRLPDLPVPRDACWGVAVPLLDDADVGPHRQRTLRRGNHRAAEPAGGRPELRGRPVRALPRRPGRPRRCHEGAVRASRRRRVQRLREPVRPQATDRATGRAGPGMGARRRPEPGVVVPRSGCAVRHRVLRGRIPAPWRPGRRAEPRSAGRRRAGSSSWPSRSPATTRSSHT